MISGFILELSMEREREREREREKLILVNCVNSFVNIRRVNRKLLLIFDTF